MPPARLRWEVLAHVQHVVWTRPDVAHAVSQLSLRDQLELTLELLRGCDGTELEFPPNVIPFRSRRSF